MNILILLTFLFGVNIADTQTAVTEQIVSYLQNIKQSNDADLNFWALNEVYSSSCLVNKQAQRTIQSSQVIAIKRLFTELTCGDNQEVESKRKLDRLINYSLSTGSYVIAVNYLVQEEDQEKRIQFKNAYLEKWGNTLTDEKEYLLVNVLNREHRKYIFSQSKEDAIALFFILTNVKTDDFFTLSELNIYSEYFSALKSKNPEQNLFRSIIEFGIFKTSYELDRYKVILENFRDFTNSTSFPNSEIKLRSLSGIDYSLAVLGRFDESLFLQRNHSLPLARYYSKKEMLDDILLRQSSYLYLLGKYKEAKEILEKMYADEMFSASKGQLFTNLSLCYLKLGEQQKYVNLLLQALPEKNEQTDYKIVLGIYRNLFSYYSSIGDSSSAMPYIELAKEMAFQKNDATEIAAIHNYLGSYYWQTYHDAEKALLQFDIAEKEYNASDDYINLTRVLLNRADVLIRSGSLDKAFTILNEVREKSLENSDTPRYLTALISLAEISLLKHDFDTTEEYLNKIKVYPLDNLEFEVLIKYHSVKTLLLQNQGGYREAYAYFAPVMEQIKERAKESSDSQTGFWSIQNEFLDAFEIMVSLLIEMDRYQDAVAYLDQYKTINEAALYNSPLLRASKLSEEELIEDTRLNNRIKLLRSRYLSTSKSDKVTIKAEIDRLSAQRQVITHKVIKDLDSYRTPIWRIQSRLKTNELLLHFTELNDRLYISSITKNKIDISSIQLSTSVRQLFEEAANSLASGATSLNKLYQVFTLLKLNHIPSSIKRVSVIPDNYLYRIPLDVLPIAEPNSDVSFGSTRYMVEDFSFEYFTSLSDFTHNTRQTHHKSKHDFSAFAISYFDDFSNVDLPSLPYATQEVQQIEQSLSKFENKELYIGDNATKQSFINEINESSIVHIATHSEVSEQDPLFSTIYLKNGNSNQKTDNKGQNALFAYELFDTALNNDLIMLNSCSSGSGNYMQGTGIMGISRALRYAGAKSLALNLWSVNDRVASIFATDFYSFLNQGYSKSDAMRMAKKNQLKYGNADPHFWGAYSLIGNPSPITKKPANAIIMFPLIIIITLLVSLNLRKT